MYSNEQNGFNNPNQNHHAQQPQSHQNNQGFRSNQPAPMKPGQANDADNKKTYLQITAYGAKYAIQCGVTTSQSGWHTVVFDAASKASNDPNDRKYDWKNKLSLQLTQTELPYFVAFALGYLPSIRFDSHGDTNKWLEIVHQKDKFFLKCGSNQANSIRAVPVGLAEMTMFGALALKQYSKNFDLSADAALEGIKLMGTLAFNNNAFKPANP